MVQYGIWRMVQYFGTDQIFVRQILGNTKDSAVNYVYVIPPTGLLEEFFYKTS